MITILKNLWLSREDRKIELAKKLEEAQSRLDLEIDKENFDHNAQPTSCMKNVLQNSVARNNLRDGNSNEETNCFNRTGKQMYIFLKVKSMITLVITMFASYVK